jgi:prolyl 4-hydroxylase
MSEARLAEIGKSTAARLKKAPGMQVVPGIGAEVYLLQNFLSARECGALIAMIDADRKPSTVLSAQPDPGFRTSESCDLDRWNPFVESIDARICKLMGMKPRQGETLQGQRYAVGQQFKAHHDYFPYDMPYWQDEKARGGQRAWTAMIYLDQPAGGGDTWFSNAGFRITPRTGMLLAWNNMDAAGKPNPQTLHESVPVTAGIKNIVTKWYRERFWF